MEQWKEHFALVESSAGSNFFFFFVDTGASLLSLSGKMCVCVCVWYTCMCTHLVTQSCLTLLSTNLLCPWKTGKNTGVGSHSLLQGIFLTQGSNPRLLHCKWMDSLPLSHQGSPEGARQLKFIWNYSAHQPLYIDHLFTI